MTRNLAVMTVLILTLYGSPVSCSDSCNPNIDAFEYLEINKVNIIKYRTYSSTQICVIFNQTEIDDVTKSATYAVTSFYIDTATTVKQIQINQVTNCSNQVQVLKESGELIFERYLLYGDATCGIFEVVSPQKGCAMFLPPGATEQNIQDCLERFEEMCGSTKYDAYPSSCSSLA